MPRSQFLQNLGSRYIFPAFAAAAPLLWKETQRAGRVALNTAVRRAVYSGTNRIMPTRRYRYRMRPRYRRMRRRMPVRARRRKPYRRSRYKRYRGGRMRIRQNTLRQYPVYRKRRSRRQVRSDLRICAAVRRCMQEKKELVLRDGSEAFAPVTLQYAFDPLAVGAWNVAAPMIRYLTLLEGTYGVPQGDGRDERTGDQIYVVGIKLGLDFTMEAGTHSACTQYITCMVFKHTQAGTFDIFPNEVWVAPERPQVSQLLRTEDRNQDKPFQIIWKRTYSYNLGKQLGLNNVDSTYVVGTGGEENTAKRVTIWIPIGDKLNYDTNLKTLKNNHYSFVVFQHSIVRPNVTTPDVVRMNIREHRIHFKE